MPLEVDITAGNASAFATTAELEDVRVRFEFRWLPRVARWAVVATNPGTRTPVGIEQHVTDAGELLLDKRRDNVPPGRLIFWGQDPYERDDLGDTMRLLYFTAAEVAGG